MARPDSKWYKLDSAGILYSALQKEEYSAIYRFSARMEREVDPAALQRAIDRCMPRFPSFAVRIRKGLFWYYLEPNHAPGPFLKEDVSDPCQPVRFREDNGWLVRFYYYRERISVEVFHALSDGGGAIVFFRTLLAEYLRQTGVDVPAGNGVLDLNEPPREEELEDAYARYAGRHAFGLRRLPRAYQNIGTPEPFYTFHVTMGFVPLSRLREQAKKHNASITEYLSAVLIHVILEKQKRERPYRERPVALAVPINLRAWFPSETLRNFITTVRPYIDPALGDYTFPEIVSQVRHFMKLHINRQELQAAFTGNVRFTENFALRLIPVVLKNPVMALNYRLFGVRPYSCTYTNPGAFTVPPEMAAHIRGAEVLLGQATVPRCHCASISYGVELDPGAARCPLCGTPAWKPDPDAPSYFPTKPAEVPPASRRAAAALLTAMLASVSLCCGVLNLLLPTERPWSLYVIGAAVMLWIWFVLPMLARRIPIFFRLTADVAAVGVYVFLISIDLSGGAWFRGLALPILGWACVLVFLLSFLLRGGRRSRLSAIAMCIGTVGLMALGVEYCMDRFFRAAWQPTWSLVVVVICVGLIIPLRVVRRVPSLREEARRRFNM